MWVRRACGDGPDQAIWSDPAQGIVVLRSSRIGRSAPRLAHHPCVRLTHIRPPMRGLHAAGAVRARRHRDLCGRAGSGLARARARDGARHGAVQVVSRRARAHAGVPLAAARPRGGERAPDRRRDRDEVPVVRDQASEQGRVAAAPVPPGVGPRPHRARAVLRVGRGPRAATEGARARQGDAR